MRAFALHLCDKSSSDANRRLGTVSTDVLEILPAELVGLKERVHKSFDISISCCD